MPNLNLIEQQTSLVKAALLLLVMIGLKMGGPALFEMRIFTSFFLVYYMVKAQECRLCKTMSFNPIRKHCCRCDK